MIQIRKLHKAILTIGESQMEVERIGKGRYTTAWRNSHYVYLQVHEKDSSKEILSKMPKNPHLPVITEIGWMDDTFRLFREPLYQPLLAKEKEAWDDFKLVRECHQMAQRIGRSAHQGRRMTAQEINQRFEDVIDGCASIKPDMREAIQGLCQWAMDYGEYCIEITKKNCAVDHGRLILLDPLFDLAEVERAWDDAANRGRTK